MRISQNRILDFSFFSFKSRSLDLNFDVDRFGNCLLFFTIKRNLMGKVPKKYENCFITLET